MDPCKSLNRCQIRFRQQNSEGKKKYLISVPFPPHFFLYIQIFFGGGARLLILRGRASIAIENIYHCLHIIHKKAESNSFCSKVAAPAHLPVLLAVLSILLPVTSAPVRVPSVPVQLIQIPVPPVPAVPKICNFVQNCVFIHSFSYLYIRLQ